MPDAGGNDGASPLSFTRRALEQAARCREADHEGVNPHKFYRGLREHLVRLRGPRDPPYEVLGQRARDLRFDPDAAGQRTGAFTARMQARSTTPALGPALLDHRPYGPQGAGLAGIGLLVVCFGLVSDPLLLLGSALTLVGLGIFSHTDEATIPLQRRDVVSALVEGEARESMRSTPSGQRSELSAEMGVVYAGDVFLQIPARQVSQLPWAVRTELANRRSRWSRALADDRETDGDVATGFLDALRAWTLLEGEWTRHRIESLQREARGSLRRRQTYTRLLSRMRPTDVRSRELDRIERDLDAWAAAMDAYIAHERERPIPRHNGHAPPTRTDGDRRRSRTRDGHARPPLRARTDRPLEAVGWVQRAEARRPTRRTKRS
jgi:hypothetical protein